MTTMILARIGAGLLGLFFYLILFWVAPLDTLRLDSRLEYFRRVIGVHVVAITVVWGGWGVIYLWYH